MANYRAIYGTAIPINPLPDQPDNVRIYNGRFVGQDTIDVDYFCSLACVREHMAHNAEYDDELPSDDSWITDPGYLVTSAMEDDDTFGTIDVERVYGDWPDYDVSCDQCDEKIHEGTE